MLPRGPSSIDLRRIADAQKKALVLVEDPEKRRNLEQFLESTGPLVEAAVRDAMQELVEGINPQLAPHSRLRLVQEGPRLLPEIVSLEQDTLGGQTLRLDRDSTSKFLVRMPSAVKARATQAAQQAGKSLNSWTVTILERALGNLREHQQGSDQPESQGQDGGTSSAASGQAEDQPSSDPKDQNG